MIDSSIGIYCKRIYQKCHFTHPFAKDYSMACFTQNYRDVASFENATDIPSGLATSLARVAREELHRWRSNSPVGQPVKRGTKKRPVASSSQKKLLCQHDKVSKRQQKHVGILGCVALSTVLISELSTSKTKLCPESSDLSWKTISSEKKMFILRLGGDWDLDRGTYSCFLAQNGVQVLSLQLALAFRNC